MRINTVLFHHFESDRYIPTSSALRAAAPKWFSSICTNNHEVEKPIEVFTLKEQEQERISRFVTLAIALDETERYISENEMKRRERIAQLKASVYSKEAMTLAQSKQAHVQILFPIEQPGR